MNRQRQKGSALFMALMILVIVTVIGLSLASESRLDLTAIGAFQNKQQVLEVAAAAVERELTKPQPAFGGTRASTYTAADLGVDFDVSVALNSTHESITEPPEGGFTLGAGFSAFHYKVEATATGMGNASVTVEQGYYILGPSQ